MAWKKCPEKIRYVKGTLIIGSAEAFTMWDQEKRSRFQELRQRQEDDALTEADRSELAKMIQELEDAEASYLAPAAERLRRERENVTAQNRRLEVLATRKEALTARLRSFLAEAQAERRAIGRELAEVMGAGRGSTTDA
jgi:hypothetical protein